MTVIDDALTLHGDLVREGISPKGARRLPTRTELASGARFGDMDSAVDAATVDLARIVARPGVVYVRNIRRSIDALRADPAELLNEVQGLTRKTLTAGYERSRAVAVENMTNRLQQLVDDSAEAALKELERQGLAGVRVPAPGREAILRAYVASCVDEPALRAAIAVERSVRANPFHVDAVPRALDAASKAAGVGAGSGTRDLIHQAALLAQAMGRAEVFSTLTGVRFVASELRDTSTCSPCLGADGTVFETWAEAAAFYPGAGYVDCRGGLRCRGAIIVERL